MRRGTLIVMLSMSLVPLQASGGGGTSGAGAGPPPDYADRRGLSEPVYRDIVRHRYRIPMWDGVRLYVEVHRPRGDGRFPVILEWSPYNGLDRKGYLPTRTGGLAGYFARRGYAVALADVRGTGSSEGCLDYMGGTDVKDARSLIGWLGTRAWSSGRVGMTGVSYVGSTPIIAAASGAPHLKTIVPVAGIAQMYDHQFQAGVPYWLQWIGAAGTYETYSVPTDRADPDWPRNIGHAGCGAPNSALANGPDLLTGRFTAWHAARDHRADAARADIPIFLVQGFRDGSVRQLAMEWFVRARGLRPGDKVWLGQWGHDASDRRAQWVGALHRWFDKHLQLREVDTGPPVEVFLNGDPYVVGGRGPVRTGTSWPATTGSITLYPAAGGWLADAPPPSATSVLPATAFGVGLRFYGEAVAEPTEIAGFPEVTLNVTLLGGRIDVIAALYDVDPHGVRQHITQAAMNPELRNGLGVVTPIVPGERMTLRPPVQPLDYLLPRGHRLMVEIISHHGDKVPLFAGPGTIILHTGGPDPTRITLGTVDGVERWRDPMNEPDPGA